MNQSPPQVIADISDANFSPNFSPKSNYQDFQVRIASRGILAYKDNIALLSVTKNNFHKLPGGGLEVGETPEQAFHREILEETGCHCHINNFAGITLEYRHQFQLVQISYVFSATVTGKPGKPHFDCGEQADGFSLTWVPTSQALHIFESDAPLDYEAKFIHCRDTTILNRYLVDKQ